MTSSSLCASSFFSGFFHTSFVMLSLAFVSCSDNVIEEIRNKLQDVRNPMSAMTVLTREMDLETDAELGGEAPIPPGGSTASRQDCRCVVGLDDI